MGEWSDYFEDFPEESPENYVNGKFDPEGAALLRKQKAKISAEQAALNKEIADIAQKHRVSRQPK